MKGSKRDQILSAYLLRIGIAVMVLLVAAYLYFRVDVSHGKAYSLGKYSRETASKLQDRVVVKIYATKDLPGEFSTVHRYLKDVLTEFRRAGKGKFSFEYARFKDAAELREQAQINGLQPIPVQMYENDQIVMKEVILGVVFESQGRFDVMNIYPGLEPTLEYELTKRIQNIDGKLLPSVTVFQDSIYKYFPTQLITDELNDNYNVVVTDLDSLPRFNPVMLFTGVVASLSDTQLYNLDQYIMKGGKVVFLQDRINSDQNSAFTFDSNLFDLLAHYGVLVHPNMVLDRIGDVRSGRGLGQQLPYPIYPIVRGMENSPITRGTDNTVMYFASEIAPLDSVNIKFEPILQTSADSGKLPGPNFNLEAVLFPQGGQYTLGKPPITVAASVKGKLKSYFGDKPQLQKPGFIASRDNAAFTIFGDRELYMDPDKPEFINRCYVVLNAIDHYLENPSMIRIRTRRMFSSRLDIPYYMYKKNIMPAEPLPVMNRIKATFKAIAIALPPLMMLIMGLLVWLSRRPKGVHAS